MQTFIIESEITAPDEGSVRKYFRIYCPDLKIIRIFTRMIGSDKKKSSNKDLNEKEKKT